jgi:hypothetical protein
MVHIAAGQLPTARPVAGLHAEGAAGLVGEERCAHGRVRDRLDVLIDRRSSRAQPLVARLACLHIYAGTLPL